MNPNATLHELSNWPYDLKDKYSSEYLISKLPMKVKDFHLKIMRTKDGFQCWYTLQGVCVEAKELDESLCRLAILLIRQRKGR